MSGSPRRTRQTAYKNFDIWVDLDANGSLTTRYMRGDAVDEVFARIDQSGGSGTGYYYLTDRLGSIREVTGSGGSVLDAISYGGFGQIASETNSSYRENKGRKQRGRSSFLALSRNAAEVFFASLLAADRSGC